MNTPQAGRADAAADARWMGLALEQARAANAAGEVPVGAVVVRAGELVATGRNASLGRCDPSAHAEVEALRAAGQRLGNYRLEGCTLYVTLEPCAMCAGALLHARVARVVYGARDPRTGAAGSVIDLFADTRLNHHTRVEGGVLAGPCAALLEEFFRARRRAQRPQYPLRPDALRTPEARFAGLPGPAWPARYLSDLPPLEGLRLHYVDTGAPTPQAPTWLLVHGPHSWSHGLRHLAAALAAAGQRVVVPDLPGFGRSDKPKREQAHTPAWHRQVLGALVERLDLRCVVLVAQQAAWAHALAALAPGRIHAVLSVDAGTMPCDAPYPDAGHRAGPRALARWPQAAEADGAAGVPAIDARRLGVDPSACLDTPEAAGRLARAAVPYFFPRPPDDTERAPGA